ncbi:MAG: ribonuclease HIII [Planctomycetota bacterium]
MSTTLKMTPSEIDDLRRRLEEERFEFRPLQYAHFQARGDGVIVSAYKSGKVVVQGKNAAAFLGDDAVAPPKLDVAVAGSDESGKGDYFGPLVVAAVVVAPGEEEEIRSLGVRDCKQMADSSILRVAAALRERFPHGVVKLDPPGYNEAHARDGNVAIFLSRMHAQALAEAVGGADDCGLIVIDKFTSVARLKGALAEESLTMPVEIRPKAEDNPAVAAASVLARAEFLLDLRELGHEWGVELPKGAGRPVDVAARDIYRSGGRATLDKIAKTHFRTTSKVMQQEF